MTPQVQVQVLGAGVIGLSVADELERRGYDVHVCDPAPASGASWVAAGMLSPASETWHGEEELLDLGRRSLALWPAYAARLDVPLHEEGTLLVAVDAGDREELDRHRRLLERLATAGDRVADELPVEPVDRRRLAGLEPGLGPAVSDALLLPVEASVDPRAVLRSLRARIPVHPMPVGAAEVTVVATGASLPTGRPELEPWRATLRRVRGEIVRVRTDDPPRHTVRGWVRGEPVYLVPRVDGSGDVLVGATSEEHDRPAVVTVEGVHRLLAAAAELCPALARAEFVEARAGDRPGTPDNLPLVGPVTGSVTGPVAGPVGEDPGASGATGALVMALGHFRHGVLLAPLTAVLVADHLETGYVEPALDPRRFVATGVPA